MTDPDIFGYINELSAEEERLYADASDGSGLSTEASERLEIWLRSRCREPTIRAIWIG